MVANYAEMLLMWCCGATVTLVVATAVGLVFAHAYVRSLGR